MTTTRLIRSVAGMAMLGIGSFILRENLDQAATWLNHVLGVNEGLGLVTAVAMGAMRGWQAYALDRPHFVHDVLPFALALCRSFFLIVGGAFLSRDLSRTTATRFANPVVEMSDHPGRSAMYSEPIQAKGDITCV